MKLPNLLDHPALNQLRLGMDAPLVSIDKGWSPRLLNPEKLRQMGRAASPLQMPVSTGDKKAVQGKPKARPPTEYLREKGSKILNPLEPVRGEVEWSSSPRVAEPSPRVAEPSLRVAEPGPRVAPKPAPAPNPKEPASSSAATSDQRRRRNQDALDRLKDL